MKLSNLKNNDYLWWGVACLTGAVLWSLPILLKPDGKDAGTFFLIAALGLLLFGFAIGYFKPQRPWRWALASVLLLPIIELSVQARMSFLYLLVKVPVYALQGLPVLIGASLGAYVKKRAAKNESVSVSVAYVKKRAAKDESFNLLLMVTVGLISGLAFLTFKFTMVCAIMVVGSASIIGLIRPPRLLFHTAIAALGIPVVVILRIIYDTAASISDHNLFPIEIIFALIPGAILTFSGMALGIGLRFILKKALPVQGEKEPSRYAWSALITVFVIILGILLYKITSIVLSGITT